MFSNPSAKRKNFNIYPFKRKKRANKDAKKSGKYQHNIEKKEIFAFYGFCQTPGLLCTACIGSQIQNCSQSRERKLISRRPTIVGLCLKDLCNDSGSKLFFYKLNKLLRRPSGVTHCASSCFNTICCGLSAHSNVFSSFKS